MTDAQNQHSEPCGDCGRPATDAAPEWRRGQSVWAWFCHAHAEARIWGWQRFGWPMPVGRPHPWLGSAP